ncbi:MAG TPA: hypothetical protein VLN61_06880 [Pseudolabrys sp.]|nr:hypothetical protein [Pseudolabrys sp.]
MSLVAMADFAGGMDRPPSFQSILTTRFGLIGKSKCPAPVTGTIIHAGMHALNFPANGVFFSMSWFLC